MTTLTGTDTPRAYVCRLVHACQWFVCTVASLASPANSIFRHQKFPWLLSWKHTGLHAHQQCVCTVASSLGFPLTPFYITRIFLDFCWDTVSISAHMEFWNCAPYFVMYPFPFLWCLTKRCWMRLCPHSACPWSDIDSAWDFTDWQKNPEISWENPRGRPLRKWWLNKLLVERVHTSLPTPVPILSTHCWYNTSCSVD